MNRKSLVTAGLAGILSLAAQAKADLYDDFSSGVLDTTKWTESQDPEGQQFTEEHFVDNSLFNYHTQQVSIIDRRTYLVPTIQFNSGDSLDYRADYISGSGNNGHLILVNDGLGADRHGVFGFNGGNHPYEDGFGTYNIHLDFFENQILISGEGPNGLTWENQVLNNTASAPYNLFIGNFSGHNGNVHIDFDDFYINGIPEPSSLSLLGLAGLLSKRRRN